MLKENGIQVTTQPPVKLNKKPRNVEHPTSKIVFCHLKKIGSAKLSVEILLSLDHGFSVIRLY